MNPHHPPSLLGNRGGPPTLVPRPGQILTPLAAAIEPRTLLDLLYDGFYMLFLLKNRYAVGDVQSFRAKLRDFLTQVDKGGKRINASSEDVYLAKYAFCALMDEVVLSSRSSLSESWQRNPLQLELFGDQLAGETFFTRLEELRAQGAARVQVLEVFHMCLLLGFQGKYLIEGSEKLGYLTARLGDEIATHKGRRASFAPHGLLPDRIAHKLRSEVPLWILGSVLALATLLAFLGMRWMLDRQTRGDLGAYAQVIKLPAQQAHVTITLP